MRKLNQVLATEKGLKTRVYAEFSELHKMTQKADLLNGLQKNYAPKDEDGDKIPPQRQRVQLQTDQVLAQVSKMLAGVFDATATKDYANCSARADVKIGGTTLLTGVPATFLLFLDKQLSDLVKFVTAFVELDPSVDWEMDPQTGQWKSPAVSTHRTEKKQRPLVMYDATDKHPAQTQLLVEDVVVGYWETVRFSGAMPKAEKQRILDRIQALMHAVKEALEEANNTPAPDQHVGQAVFSYLFAGA